MKKLNLANPRGRIISASITELCEDRFCVYVSTYWHDFMDSFSTMEKAKIFVASEYTGGDGIKNQWIEEQEQ